MEVIFGKDVQHAHTHTNTCNHALPENNGHVWWVQEPDLIFLPVSVLGHLWN